MKHVSCMGEVWKLTDGRYKKMVQYIAAGGKDLNLDDYGTHLGAIDMNVTDLDHNVVHSCKMETPGYPEYEEWQKLKKQHGL